MLTNKIPHIVAFLGFQYINKCTIGYLIAEKHDKKNIIMIWLLIVAEYFWVDLNRFICDIIAMIIFMIINKITIVIKKERIRSTVLWLSKSSYFIYLFHQMVGYTIIGIFDQKMLPSYISIMSAILFVLATSWVYSKTEDKIRKKVSSWKHI